MLPASLSLPLPSRDLFRDLVLSRRNSLWLLLLRSRLLLTQVSRLLLDGGSATILVRDKVAVWVLFANSFALMIKHLIVVLTIQALYLDRFTPLPGLTTLFLL